jgi:hypothetical protein
VAEFSYRLGQTWEYVEDNLTVRQLTAYRNYWHTAPPVDTLAAAWMGFKPPTPSNEDGLEKVAHLLGGLPS